MKKLLVVLAASLVLASQAIANCTLRQSDAMELALGPYVDQTDGFTAETALTISQADVILKKCAAGGDCGAAAQKNDSSSCAHDANGMYECDFNTTDTDTVGILEIWSFEAGALPVFKTCEVVEEAVFDRDHAAAATGIVGTAQTGDSFARLGAPAGASVSADIVVLDNFVDDLESRLGTPANLGGGATVAGNLNDIEGQTDDIGAAGAGLTVLATQSSVTTIDDFLDTEIAAILDDTGTSGVVIAEATANCREVIGCDTQGTLSGTHSTTTADLGTNAPANDITGMTLEIPTHNFSRVITSYNTGTGVATFDPVTAVTLANSNQYYLWATAPSSGGGGGLDAAGVRAAVGLATANLDTQLSTIDDFVDTEVAAILDDTGTSGVQIPSGEIVAATFGAGAIDAAAMNVTGSEFTAVPYNSAWDAEIQSEAADALSAIFLDQLLANTYNPATPPGATDSFLEDLVDSDAGVTRFNSNALELAPTSGGGNMTSIEGVDATDVIDARIAAAALATAASLDTVDNFVDTEVADIQARLPAALVSGRIDSSVGAMAANTLTATAINTDAITAAKVAADVTTELQTGLATAAALTTVDDFVDTEVAAIVTAVDAVPTNAELATALGTADDATLAAVDAVPTAAENVTALMSAQGAITGTCDSGSTTTCVDNALTQASALQLEDRLICFDDAWCALLVTFNPGTDTATTTKVAPSTRSGKAYTIFPATLE